MRGEKFKLFKYSIFIFKFIKLNENVRTAIFSRKNVHLHSFRLWSNCSNFAVCLATNFIYLHLLSFVLLMPLYQLTAFRISRMQWSRYSILRLLICYGAWNYSKYIKIRISFDALWLSRSFVMCRQIQVNAQRTTALWCVMFY